MRYELFIEDRKLSDDVEDALGREAWIDDALIASFEVMQFKFFDLNESHFRKIMPYLLEKQGYFFIYDAEGDRRQIWPPSKGSSLDQALDIV